MDYERNAEMRPVPVGRLHSQEPSFDLDIRLEFFAVEINALDSSQWVKDSDIAKATHSSNRLVRDISTKLGVETEFKKIGSSRMNAIYPPYATFIITEEILWRQAFRKLPDYLSVYRISESIGRSYGYTETIIEQLAIQPDKVVKRGEHRGKRYKKKKLEIIREYNMATPFDDENLNLAQLHLLLGKDREWITARLDMEGFEPETRRNGISGHAIDHYPPECLDILRSHLESVPPPPNDGWLTAQAIEELIGRSANWTRKRLEECKEVAEVRLGGQNVPRWHYPPEVVSEIIAESERARNAPEKGEYLSTSDMAKALGKSWKWVENRIDRFSELGEERTDTKGRLNMRYPPKVLDELRNERDELLSYPEAEDYLSVRGLAEAIGRTDYWVSRRLAKLAITGELRRSGNKKLHVFYPPEIIDTLKDTD